jgi:hypothetical protein
MTRLKSSGASYAELFRLDASLHSDDASEMAASVARVGLLLSSAPPSSQLLNAGFLKLADAFAQCCARHIRAVVVRSLSHAAPRCTTVLNRDLILVRLVSVLRAPERKDRVLALQALGAVAPLWQGMCEVVGATVLSMRKAPAWEEVLAGMACLESACSSGSLWARFMAPHEVGLCLAALKQRRGSSEAAPRPLRARLFSLLSYSYEAAGTAAESANLCVAELCDPSAPAEAALCAMRAFGHLARRRPELWERHATLTRVVLARACSSGVSAGVSAAGPLSAAAGCWELLDEALLEIRLRPLVQSLCKAEDHPAETKAHFSDECVKAVLGCLSKLAARATALEASGTSGGVAPPGLAGVRRGLRSTLRTLRVLCFHTMPGVAEPDSWGQCLRLATPHLPPQSAECTAYAGACNALGHGRPAGATALLQGLRGGSARRRALLGGVWLGEVSLSG